MTTRSRFTRSRRRLVPARLLTVAALALLAAPTVTEAAATDTTAPAAETGTSAPAAECPSSAEGQSIQMWSPLTGPDGETMTALAEQFSSENELGISVEHVAQPEYVQRLNAAAAADELPAMTVVRVINVGELAARNVLRPFTEETMAILGEDFGSDFPENVWVRGEYQGERYSIPLDIHTLVMYYNRDLFEAAGVEEPGTEPMSREAFEAALADLEESGVQPIAIGTGFQGATLFQSLITQFGGALTNEEGTEVTYASDAGVQALEYVNELKQQYSPDLSGANDPEVAFFKQGQSGDRDPRPLAHRRPLPARLRRFRPVPTDRRRVRGVGGIPSTRPDHRRPGPAGGGRLLDQVAVRQLGAVGRRRPDPGAQHGPGERRAGRGRRADLPRGGGGRPGDHPAPGPRAGRRAVAAGFRPGGRRGADG